MCRLAAEARAVRLPTMRDGPRPCSLGRTRRAAAAGECTEVRRGRGAAGEGVTTGAAGNNATGGDAMGERGASEVKGGGGRATTRAAIIHGITSSGILKEVH